jgi:hypothetical protein
MDNIDQVAVESTETIDTAEVVETTEATQEEPKVEAPKETPEQKVARLQRQLTQAKKQAGIVEKPKTEAPTGDAEDTIALLLEVKGLKEDDEVALFQTWRNDTKRQPRDILNNKIFQAELTALRTDKATQAAIPMSNGRGAGGSSVNVDALVEKFQRTGELPKHFDLKARVLDVVANSIDEKTPPWRR